MDSTIDFDQYQQTVRPSNRYSEMRILSTDGRVGRFEYFFYSLVVPFLVFWIAAALAGISSHFGELGRAIAYVLLAAGACAALIIYLQLTIQRCHDFNASGWFSLLLLLPLASILFWIIPGNSTVNNYGEPTRPPTALLKIGAGLLLLLLVATCTFFLLNHFKV